MQPTQPSSYLTTNQPNERTNEQTNKQTKLLSVLLAKFGWLNHEEYDGQGMWHVWGKWKVQSGFWWETWRQESLGAYRRIMYKWFVKKQDGRRRTLIWVRAGQEEGSIDTEVHSAGNFWTSWWTTGFSWSTLLRVAVVVLLDYYYFIL